jgi:hypothetical protein
MINMVMLVLMEDILVKIFFKEHRVEVLIIFLNPSLVVEEEDLVLINNNNKVLIFSMRLM